MAGDTARTLFREALVCDLTLPWSPARADDVTLARYHAAGIGFISLTASIDVLTPDLVLQQVAWVNGLCAREPGKYALIATVNDIHAAHAAGKLALSLNVQGTNPLVGKVGMVEVFYRLGVRHMLLAYNQKNLVGDGCAERTDAGLSRYGIAVIREMNRVGMLVDGTHCGYRTTMEAMEVSSAPFIFSHCNPYAVFAHYRNIRDDQIKACAKTGGVIGINGMGAFLGDPEATTGSMFRHLDYLVNLVGPQHVAIGLDYVKDGAGFWAGARRNPEAWPPVDGKPHPDTRFAEPEQIEALTELMESHGYGETAMRGILGENFLRVARAVWK